MDLGIIVFSIFAGVGVIIGMTIIRYLEMRKDKQQEKFDREFAKEEAERNQQIQIAKLDGTLNIDKLIQIYYPDSKPVYTPEGKIAYYDRPLLTGVDSQ